MKGLGTLINSISILAGGIIGILFKNLFSTSIKDSLKKACGISVMFISIASSMEGMLRINNNTIVSDKSLLIVLCLTIGTFLGEIIGIDKAFENFGSWLKIKTNNSKDSNFINAFVSATFTVCIGAMAIVGALEDGLNGNYSILLVKSILDFIIVAVLTASLGKGSIYSAIPIFIFEGLITVFASFISPLITELALNYISLIGSLLIFCVGINLIWDNTIKIANMLPSLVIAIIFAYFKIL